MRRYISIAIAIAVIIMAVGAAIFASYSGDYQKKVYCNEEDRQGGVCIEIYEPVCGWFNENVQCIKYPCAETFGNSCFSCLNPDVAYYTEGECPQ